jgi:hypothetical protein
VNEASVGLFLTPLPFALEFLRLQYQDLLRTAVTPRPGLSHALFFFFFFLEDFVAFSSSMRTREPVAFGTC